MSITIHDVFMALAFVLAVVLAYFVIPLLKSKYGSESMDQLLEMVMIAVRAAEQIYKQSGAGAEKKAYVLEYLQAHGYAVDEQTIDNMIEACVLEINREVNK